MTMDCLKEIFQLICVFVITLCVHHLTAHSTRPGDKQGILSEIRHYIYKVFAKSYKYLLWRRRII